MWSTRRIRFPGSLPFYFVERSRDIFVHWGQNAPHHTTLRSREANLTGNSENLSNLTATQPTWALGYPCPTTPVIPQLYFWHSTSAPDTEMPLMFGGKIGKQKIYISAINGPSLPPKHLKTGVGPSVVQSCHSLSLLFGGKRENMYFCHQWPFLAPQTLSNCQTPSKLSQVLLTKSPWQECVSVNRSCYYRPPHLHCQTEFGTNLTPLNNRLQCRR